MTGKKTPKELLADEDMLGFVRSQRSGGQVLRRATSAKVTVESTEPLQRMTDSADTKKTEP
jgi:hypothetical protein